MTAPDQPCKAEAASMQVEATASRLRDPRIFTTFLAGRLINAGGLEDLCRVRNISTLGMLIETRLALTVGEDISVELRTGEHLAGTVIWKAPGRSGIKLKTPIDVKQVLTSHLARPMPKAARAPRFSAGCKARMTCMGRSCVATVENLSQSGARVKLAGPFPLAIPLTLRIPGLGARQCAIRWSKGEEVGLAFLETIPFEELSTWLNQAAGDVGAIPSAAAASG